MKAGKPGDREQVRRGDVGRSTVWIDAVHMGRKGWRFEVGAEFTVHVPAHYLHDPEGLTVHQPAEWVRRRDVVWLPSEDDATQLYRATEEALSAGVSTFQAAGQLSGLARELGV